MSITVAAALKKIAVYAATDKKFRKIVLGTVLGVILILILPIAAITAILSGEINIDRDRLQALVIENMSDEEKAKLLNVERIMTEIENKMREAGYGTHKILAAHVLTVSVLSEYADEPGYADKLIGCFAPEQTDAQLIENVNAAFGTNIAADEFSKLLASVHKSLVAVALSQVGNVGGEPYWSWYGFDRRAEWCACFVSWCANECGYIDAGLIPKFAVCVYGADWFKNKGRWLDGTETPESGMIIFFDWDNRGSSGPQDGLSDHVGIVEKVENGIVHTIEGNSGDMCRQKQYNIGHYEILGYGFYEINEGNGTSSGAPSNMPSVTP